MALLTRKKEKGGRRKERRSEGWHSFEPVIHPRARVEISSLPCIHVMSDAVQDLLRTSGLLAVDVRVSYRGVNIIPKRVGGEAVPF